MKIKLRAYENGDHVGLIWFPDDFKPIADCRGFGIVRRRKAGGGAPVDEFVRNFTGFTDDVSHPPDATEAWKWPIQRYLWADYFVKPGDTVSYSVIPVVGSNKKGTLKLAKDLQSEFTDEIAITGRLSEHMSAYFNKGIIATQW